MYTLALAIFGELTAIFMNVVSRYLFETSFLWVDDVAKIALSIIAFIGGAFAYRRNEFVSVRAFVNQLPVGPRHVCDVMIEFIVLASAITAGVASGPLLLANWHELMPILQIPETWIDIPLTIGMAILAVSVIERLLVQHRRTVLLVGFFGLLFIGIAFATNRVWLPWMTEDVALGVELIIFFALIVLGVPVGFALLNAALVFLCFSQPTPMVALPQNMVDGTTNFVLLAIPFFIFAGAIMEQGGLSRRFVRLVQAVVGHIRGGLLQVIVVSMYLVSGMSGSKAADVAAVGSVMRSMLRRQGYDMEEALRCSRHPPPWARLSRPASPCWFWARSQPCRWHRFSLPVSSRLPFWLCVSWWSCMFVRAGPRAFRHSVPACRKCDAPPSQRHFRC